MWIEAFISTEDLRRTLAEFAPLTIAFGNDGGELALETPSKVLLVADQGARIECKARLRLPLFGIRVPMTIRSLVILLRPLIEAHPKGDALVFKLEIEHADFALVP